MSEQLVSLNKKKNKNQVSGFEPLTLKFFAKSSLCTRLKAFKRGLYFTLFFAFRPTGYRATLSGMSESLSYELTPHQSNLSGERLKARRVRRSVIIVSRLCTHLQIVNLTYLNLPTGSYEILIKLYANIFMIIIKCSGHN